MSKTTSRGQSRADRDRELAFRERQARRAQRHVVEPPPPAKFIEPRRPPRREGPRKSFVLVPFLILISLAAAGLAGYALSKEPKTADLNARISTLSSALIRSEHEITTLRSQLASSANAGNVKRLTKNLAGLRKTVGGLQNSRVPMQAEMSALKACIPQLQEELTGVASHAGRHGTTTVGLSPECSALLAG